jgi:hypothetical protein
MQINTSPSSKDAITYKLRVDRANLESPEKCPTGKGILLLAGKDPFEKYQMYLMMHGGGVRKIEYDETVCLDDPGIERFTTQKKTHQDGEPKFKFQVDRGAVESPTECLLVKELLELAGKKPYTDYSLYKAFKNGGVEKLDYETTVCFGDPGIERFTSQKLKHQDGEKKKLRREFTLPEEDEAFLNACGLEWETIIDNQVMYLLIRGVKLPSGYSSDDAEMAMRIDTTYPQTQIDMAFFSPRLSRADGNSINNLSNCVIDGREFQQWSRHRSADNPWREGIDGVPTQFGFAIQWLEDEFKGKPHAVRA